MKKILAIAMCFYMTVTHAHNVDIDLTNTTCYRGTYCELLAKYYLHLENTTDQLQTYCYGLTLSVENFKRGTKNFDECVNVYAHSKRTIGKEIRFTRVFDVYTQTGYQMTAKCYIQNDRGYEKHAQLYIW